MSRHRIDPAQPLGDHPPRYRARRSRTTLAALAAAVAVALAGCAATATPASTSDPAPASQSALALEEQFIQVVKNVSPSVVLIQDSQGLGSGVIFDTQGNIVTNNHVVAGASNVQVTLADGKQYPAQLVGSFPADDLAVLRINASGLHPATFGDSRNLAVGNVALAIGNPLGLQSSVTEGIVSAVGRTVNESNGVALPNVIQTSAAINPGNSGGALVDLEGQVIGIPTLAATDPQLGAGAAPGIGFAIPSNIVRTIATQLIEHGTVTSSNRAYLGVQSGATTNGGVLVTQVQPGGPAATAGITAGDMITAINATTVTDPATLADLLAPLKPGQTAAVAITHPGGATETVQVTLGQYPG